MSDETKEQDNAINLDAITPEQAINFVVDAVRGVSMSYNDHAIAEQARQTVVSLLFPQE